MTDNLNKCVVKETNILTSSGHEKVKTLSDGNDILKVPDKSDSLEWNLASLGCVIIVAIVVLSVCLVILNK